MGISYSRALGAPNPEADIFVKFHYVEVKDLSKHFLTLISGTLVLMVSFSEKIAAVSSAHVGQKILLGGCWVALLIAFVSAGLGIYFNYLAAEQAQGALIYNYSSDFKVLARRAYRHLDAAGIFFAAALVFLAMSGVIRLIINCSIC